MSVIRSFGIQSLAGTNFSQPLFGTLLQQASQLSPDPYTGNTNPGSNPSMSQVFLEASLGFRVGDQIAIAPKANFAYPMSKIDVGIIKTFTPGTPYTLAVVEGLQFTHGIDEYFVLNMPVARLRIIRTTTSGIIYLGNGSDVSPTAISCFAIIPAMQTTPFEFVSGDQFSPYNTLEFWAYGTSGDSFVASWDAL